MKKITTWLVVLAGIISLTAFSGCKKVWDYVKHHPGGTVSGCRVERITYSFIEVAFPAGDYKTFGDTLNIAYNAAGNPVSMKYTSSRYPEIDSIDGFSADHIFKYDSQNRLLLFLEYVSDNQLGCINWHRYNYVNNNLVVDSIFGYGFGNYQVRDRPDGGISPYWVIEYTLDDYGRIIKAREINWGYPMMVEKLFTYDASGNLVKPGVTYTGKTNIKQTNKVWMFLAKDFSVNAPAGEALFYNSNNLPTLFSKGVPFFAEPFLTPYDALARVYYKCK